MTNPCLYKTTGNNNPVAKDSRIGARASGGKKSVRYLSITTLIPHSSTTNSSKANVNWTDVDERKVAPREPSSPA
jgi:hypothetical protein